MAYLTRRRLLAAGLDLILVLAAYFLVFGFRYQASWPEQISVSPYGFGVFMVIAVVVHLAFNTLFRVYSIINRYVGVPQAIWIVKATVSSIVALIVVDLAWSISGTRPFPLSVVAVGGVAVGVAMLGLRFYSRIFQTRSLAALRKGKRIALVGAGSAAEMLVRQIEYTPALGLQVVGFLDDDPELRGMRMHQYPVLGTIADAPQVAKEHDVEEFFITIPSASPQQMERIYLQLKVAGLPIKTVPPVSELIDDRVRMEDVRSVTVEDLLGRPPVETDLAAIAGYLKGRRVLVTGAAGSIGSELCRQICDFDPESLIMVDRNESGLYDLHEEFRGKVACSYSLVTTYIQHRMKMRKIFAEYRPHVVFHAAAFKHVPLMEDSPDEAIINNVLGTLVLAQEAGEVGVERFVNISTDKAADPVSVMGASKAMAELVVRDVARDYPGTRYCSVRFGNVLGSRGSVIPIFQRQIEMGGPVTVTHAEMTRYFMSISEAVQLLLQAASLSQDEGRGGVFILEMGNPVRILEIAVKMIMVMANGTTPRIEFTGLRPGERLHELLVGRLEEAGPTSHPMVTIVRSNGGRGALAGSDFRERLEALIELAKTHVDRMTYIDALRALLPTYEPFDMRQASAFPVNGNAHKNDVDTDSNLGSGSMMADWID